MKTIITIADIRPPGEGKQSARITTTGGENFWLWSTKLGLVKVGGTYDADWEENNGFKNIKTVKQVAATASATVPFQSGAYRPQTQPASAPLTACSKDEQIFVQGVVQQLIRSGEVTLDNVEAAVNKMRGVWKRTLGRAVIQQQMEAAE